MWSYVTATALILFLVISSYTDLKERKIKNKVVLVFLFLRLMFIFDPLSWSNLYGMIFGFMVFFIPAFIINRPMGGDIKAYTIVGLYLGIEAMLVHFVFTWLITIVSYIVGKATKKMKNEYKFPMAPVFLLSYFATVLFLNSGLYDVATMTIQNL